MYIKNGAYIHIDIYRWGLKFSQLLERFSLLPFVETIPQNELFQVLKQKLILVSQKKLKSITLHEKLSFF